MIYEKKFWTHGDEFYDSNNIPYEGYVGISEGKAYKFPNGEMLSNRHTYLSNFRLSNFSFDRLLDDELELPFNKQQVTFAVNDFLNKGNIKNIIKRLLINNHYIFRCANISSPILPNISSVNVFNTTKDKNGILSRRSLEDQIDNEQSLNESAVRTLADPNFFSSETKKADFDLLDITCSDMCITGITNDKKTVRLLIVLGFRDKIVFIRTLHNIDNSPIFSLEDMVKANTIDFITNNINDRRKYIEDVVKPKKLKENSNTESEKSKYDIMVLNRVEPLSKNAIQFINIEDVVINGEELYVIDNKLNTLFKYDISQILRNENNNYWNIQSIQLLDTIQGSSMNSVVFFKNPTGVAVSNNSVYVADSGNHVIKKYTKSLDFIKTLKCGKFATQELKAIVSNPNSVKLEDGTLVEGGSLWVLSETASHVYITIISNDKVILSQQIHGFSLKDNIFDEHILNIQFSPSDSSYYYIVTNKRIVKAHTTRPTRVFGTLDIFTKTKIIANTLWRKTSFKWGGQITSIWGQSAEDYLEMKKTIINKCFCVCGCDESIKKQFNGDIIFNVMFQYNRSEVEKTLNQHKEASSFFDLPTYLQKECIYSPFITLYTAQHEFLQLLSDVDFICYDNEDVTEINDTEYIDTLTINKALYKLSYNLIQLKNTLNGRFWGFYDENGLMQYDRTVQDNVFKNIRVDSSNDSKNFFVHANEPNTIIINRTFECIWNIQNQICRFLNVVHKTASTTNSQVHTIIE